MTDESVALRLSRLPQVQAVLLQPEVVKLLAELPRWSVVQAVRDELVGTQRPQQRMFGQLRNHRLFAA